MMELKSHFIGGLHKHVISEHILVVSRLSLTPKSYVKLTQLLFQTC